jgi:phosphoacetylglucosamine mutase
MDPSVTDAIAKFGEPSKHLLYGTAGFRDKHNLPLDFVFVRMGVLAFLRTISLPGKNVGAVITASHNEEVDNGIKIVDVDGGMLSQQWEPLAVELTNCKVADFVSVCSRVIVDNNLNMTNNANTVVLIGRDTRPHSAGFHECMKQGVELVGGLCEDLGEVTTPMLHFAVRDLNQSGYHTNEHHPFQAGEWTGRYFDCLAVGYHRLIRTAASCNAANSSIVVDASNGVGSIALDAFLAHYLAAQCSGAGYPALHIDVRNPARSGKVNADCGAEHAQKLQQPPSGVNAARDIGKLMCSFDGDGDRIVFHAFISEAGK